MSIDVFQDKIRKTKNPSVLQVEAFLNLVPEKYKEETETIAAFEAYCVDLLNALKGIVPAVRFGFASFSVLGENGISVLRSLLHIAAELGYYVLLDMPEMNSALAAQNVAEAMQSNFYPADGYLVPCYLGTDVLKPFAALCKNGKTLFPIVRTANRTAPELQDLLTGSRLVHVASADIVNRLGESCVSRCGYSQIGALASAGSADSLRSLRTKYKYMFLLLDGYDYPNANAKNCSFAFDKLGHGAAACACVSFLGAWRESDADGDPIAAAIDAAERMKRNLTRYCTVL